MDTSIVYLILFGIVVAAANVFGGLILFPSTIRRNYKRLLKYLLGVGAGFMLAVTFFEIVPNSIRLWLVPGEVSTDSLFAPMLLLVIGYLLTQFFEHTVAPHIHLGEELHADELISTRSAYAGVGGLSMHTFFDGVSIAAASQIDIRMGFLVFLAVFLHKFPEGFTIGSMLVAAGKGRREVVLATALIGSMTVLGILIFYFVGSRFSSSVAYALPLASGVTLYVAASDLIPEVNHHGGKNPLVSLSVFGGVALFFAIHFFIELLGVH